MANIPMKDIQFPGLDDTYTFAQVDATLTTQGKAADAKKTGDEISELKADLTAVETDIETGNLTAGTAKQLLADTGMTDKSPYLFRAMPTGAGDREEPVIVGGSVVWNQLMKQSKYNAGTDQGVSHTIDNDGITMTLNGTATGSFRVTNAVMTSGRKFYVADANHNVRLGDGYSGNVGTGGGIISATGTSLYVLATNGTVFDNTKIKIVVTDLTAEFGTTIADYVYALEQATAGAGIAYLRKYGFFTEDYYPYTEPTFKHVEGLVSHKMVGFNQFDKDTATLYYGYLQTQENNVYVWRQANDSRSYAVKCMPNTTYCVYLNGSAPTLMRVGDTPSDELPATPTTGGWEVPLGKAYSSVVSGESRVIYTTSNTAKWLIVQFGSSMIPSRFGDICINLSDPAKNGTYEPHKEYTYPLDPDVVLRGIPKLDANNDLYYDGDVYKPDGTVSRRYGVVDLGTLTWNTTLSNRASVIIPNMKIPTQISEIVPILSENGYTQIAPSGSLTQIGQFALLMDRRLLFYYDGNTLPSGEIVYELTTPTTETADPYAPLQLADPYGTEEWVLDDEAFPMPAGQETFYPENLRAKIEGLPWNFANLIAPTEVSNVATRNYTAGNLLIVDNVLYKVTVNIANGGAITPGTNVTATTLAEIISALQ